MNGTDCVNSMMQSRIARKTVKFCTMQKFPTIRYILESDDNHDF